MFQVGINWCTSDEQLDTLLEEADDDDMENLSAGMIHFHIFLFWLFLQFS